MRPSLENIVPVLLGTGPHGAEAIEITGNRNTGKSLMIMELIINAILPQDCGGKDTQVIFIDSKTKPIMFKFPDMVERRIINYFMCKKNHQLTNEDSQYLLVKVQQSMQNLTIIECFTSKEFEMALSMLGDFLRARERVGLVVVDTMGWFYWTHMPKKTMKEYIKYSTDKALNSCREHRVVLIYTIAGYIQVPPRGDPKKVTRHIHLELAPNSSTPQNTAKKTRQYICKINSKNTITTATYEIDDFGIKWLHNAQSNIN